MLPFDECDLITGYHAPSCRHWHPEQDADALAALQRDLGLRYLAALRAWKHFDMWERDVWRCYAGQEPASVGDRFGNAWL